MISFNMLEAARLAGVKRFFYASSACIYPEFKQVGAGAPGRTQQHGAARRRRSTLRVPLDESWGRASGS